jgi:hypothetical protein
LENSSHFHGLDMAENTVFGIQVGNRLGNTWNALERKKDGRGEGNELDKINELLQKVDAEIEKAKVNPMAAMGMIIIRRIIVEMKDN